MKFIYEAGDVFEFPDPQRGYRGKGYGIIADPESKSAVLVIDLGMRSGAKITAGQIPDGNSPVQEIGNLHITAQHAIQAARAMYQALHPEHPGWPEEEEEESNPPRILVQFAEDEPEDDDPPILVQF